MKDVIDYLRNDNAIILFLADHGEALGEEGDWLHASDNKSIKILHASYGIPPNMKKYFQRKSRHYTTMHNDNTVLISFFTVF